MPASVNRKKQKKARSPTGPRPGFGLRVAAVIGVPQSTTEELDLDTSIGYSNLTTRVANPATSGGFGHHSDGCSHWWLDLPEDGRGGPAATGGARSVKASADGGARPVEEGLGQAQTMTLVASALPMRKKGKAAAISTSLPMKKKGKAHTRTAGVRSPRRRTADTR